LYWKTKKSTQTGFLFGLFLVLLMSVRVIVEQFKIAQIDSREDWVLGLNTGQVLSIPFLLIGLYFMFLYKPKSK
jgi:phosphatidylglycerol:prolipoprotein diacylglycerol transferase